MTRPAQSRPRSSTSASSISSAGTNLARIELARVRAADGQVLWSEALDVPTGPRDALIAASAVAATLRRASLALEVALARGDRTAAEEVLAEMERLQPSDPAVLAGRSRIAEQDGAIDRAIELMELVVERRGTWWDLLRLTDLEGRHGRVEAAREHLEQLLALVPGHSWGRAKLAEIELTYGDPERAAALYLELVANEPHRSDFTNLGLARLLLGRYGQAAQSFRQALAMAPGNTIATLNLADAVQRWSPDRSPSPGAGSVSSGRTSGSGRRPTAAAWSVKARRSGAWRR